MSNLLSKYVSPGCRVDLQAVRHARTSSGSGRGERKSYQSQVIEVISEDRVELTMPMEKAKLVLLPIDKDFDLYFYADSGVFQCRARVVDRYKNNNLYVMVFDLLTDLRKNQRREYYRFSCALEMKSRKVDEAELALSDKREDITSREWPMKNGIIVDISGGGLRFVAKFTYEVQSVILCKYNLSIGGESKEYNVIGKVLSVKEVENREGLFEHRVQYIDVDPTEREEIIKYIFDEERKTLRKQKGISQHK